jgi:hypothetical protein
VWAGSCGGQAGAVHLHTTRQVTVGASPGGRGQALCGKLAWWDRPVEHDSDLRVRCAECADPHEIAWPDPGRHGVPWPDGTGDRR